MNIESPNAALIAATPLKLPPPAPLPRELYELLGQFRMWVAEERDESATYTSDAVKSSQTNDWQNVVASNQRAVRAYYRAEGLNIAAAELRDVLAKLAAERGEA